jgi:hypothetical protein
MPLNEIHAPVYIKGKYTTAAYPTGHAFRLYFASGCSFVTGGTGDEENWHLHEGSTDRGGVQGIVHDVFSRAHESLPLHTAVSQIELWQSIPDAPNVLLHLNPLPEGNDFGSGAGIASAYLMQVYAGALRPQWRFTIFDGAYASPQKYPPTTPPSGDDGTLPWLFTKSPVPYATNDGIRLTRMVSYSTGYNRKLARAYGRSVTP